ncbi:S8 family serine peptidase [Sphingomonas sp. I4]
MRRWQRSGSISLQPAGDDHDAHFHDDHDADTRTLADPHGNAQAELRYRRLPRDAGRGGDECARRLSARRDGAGVTLGVIDSGLDTRTGLFDGRISSASADVAGGSRGTADEGGHGTAVAFTAVGGRGGNKAQGVAFDATLVVLRADQPGSCASGTTSAGVGNCAFRRTRSPAGSIPHGWRARGSSTSRWGPTTRRPPRC